MARKWKLKPWDELSPSGKRHRKESWKHKLPKEYDVFCMGDFPINKFAVDAARCEKEFIFPGTLYVKGDIIGLCHVTINGDCYVDGNFVLDGNITVNGNFDTIHDFNVHYELDCHHIDVTGNFTSNGLVNCTKLCVGGDAIFFDDVITYSYGDNIVRGDIILIE